MISINRCKKNKAKQETRLDMENQLYCFVQQERKDKKSDNMDLPEKGI